MKGIFGNRLWKEFTSLWFEHAGIYLETMDGAGNVLAAPARVPSICEAVAASGKGGNACRWFHLRLRGLLGAAAPITPLRCPAGLSCRLVSVAVPGEQRVHLLVGRVRTEIAGERQVQEAAASVGLGRDRYLGAMEASMTMDGRELDRVASLLRSLVWYLGILNRTRRAHLRVLRQLRQAHELVRGVAAGGMRGRRIQLAGIETLRAAFLLSGLALRAEGGALGEGTEASAAGREREALERLARGEWPSSAPPLPDRGLLAVRDAETLAAAGLQADRGPLYIYTAAAGGGTCRFFMSGREIPAWERLLMEMAFDCYAAAAGEELPAEGAAPEAGEGTARGTWPAQDSAHLEPLLAGALERAMSGSGARRGSILLVEGGGASVSASVARGPQEPAVRSLRTLSPGTVSHRAWIRGKPWLVRDVSRELGQGRRRRYPYLTSSFLSVPVGGDGAALGIMHLSDKTGGGSFTEEDLASAARIGLEAGAILEKARLEAEINHLRCLATVDPLTGTYNRRHLGERLEEELRRALRFQHPLSVIMLDLDYFRNCNSILGHAKADRILAEMTGTVREHVRSIDVLARYGGDEFVVLLPETGLKGAISIAEKIRAGIEATRFPYESQAGRKVTVSLGVATYPDMALGAEDLLNKADQAMMKAKEIGRNTVLAWSS